MRSAWRGFWAWYERHYTLNISIAAALFVLQLLHLYWLGADVIAYRLFDESFWDPSPLVENLIVFVDYTEIPALIGGSLIYINELRKGFAAGPVLMLIFLNSQWFHIFWITDEFIVDELSGGAGGSSLPSWAAWVAILIDYLELPIIFDTLRRVGAALRAREGTKAADAVRDG
jgi:hypothetical protein